MTATESQIMTNIIADPAVRTTVKEKHARVRQDVCRISTVTAEIVGHLYRLTKLKAHDVVTSVRWAADTGDTGLADFNIGIWTPSSDTDDPVVVNADSLVDGADIDTATGIPAEILGTGSGSGAVADFGKELWEYSGETEPDAGTEYEIVGQVAVGDPAGGGDYVFIIEYTHGD